MKKLLNIRFLNIYFFLLISMNLFAQELSDDGGVHQIDFSGSVDDFIIPSDVTYDRIEFFLDGGDGGKGSYCNIKGGKGTHVKAVFKIGPLPDELRPGGTVRFIVGKRGDNRTVDTAAGGAGGGGGTAILYKNPGAITDGSPSTNLFEADTNWVILAVAGAGGGAFQRRSNPGNQCGSNSKRGQGGQTGTSGGGDGINTGGTNGIGGKANSNGGAGGGYLTGGMNQGGQHSNDDGDRGGVSGGDGGTLGIDGGWGYGGGGSGAFENEGGGGGGGGFSGGGGGIEGNRRGFGGGSFVNDADLDAFRSLDGNHTVSTPKNGYITYNFFNESGVIAKCKNVTVQLDASGQQTFLPSEANDGSYTSDGSTIIGYSASAVATPGLLASFDFDCTDLGDHGFILAVLPNTGSPGFCSFNLSVVDASMPVAQCKNATVYLTGNGSGLLFPSDIDDGSFDGCSSSILFLDKEEFDCSDIGGNTVELTVQDEEDNTATCTANVTVRDIGAPELFGSSLIPTIYLDASGMGSITPNQVIIQAVDNCDNPSLLLSQSSFDCNDVGENTVTVTATDASGNSSSLVAIVSVEDNVAPQAICQNASVMLDDSGNGSLLATDVDGGSSDNCSIQSSLSQSSFSCNDIGTVSVQLTVTDQSGNANTCTANVLVVENSLPIATCKDATIFVDDQGQASLQIADVDGGSSQLCDEVSLSLSPADFDCSDLGSQEVTLTVTAQNNNQSTCTATVTVEDNIPPVALCKDLTIDVGSTGTQVRHRSAFSDGSYDNCGSVTVLNNIPPITFGCQDIGMSTITVTVSAGNLTSSCTATATIVDNIIPIAACKTATVQLDENGTGNITPGAVLFISNDPCGIQSRTVNPSSFDCDDIGTQEVTVTVTDNNGNSNTCSTTVTITDDSPPVALCQDRTINVNAIDVTFPGDPPPPVVIDDGSYDNCGDVSLSFTTEDGSPMSIFDGKLKFLCNYVGVNTVILTASDGNLSSTCSASLTVVDNQAPYVNCKPATIQLDETGNANLSRFQVVESSGDRCGVSHTLSQNQFDCDDIGTNTVTITVTDPAGNTSSCIAEVTVENNTHVTAQCQSTTIELDQNGMASITTSEIDNGSTNVCGTDISLSLDQMNFSCDDLGTNTVILTATDIVGNTSTCSAMVTIIDVLDPNIVCPDDIELFNAPGQCGATHAVIIPFAEDNCQVAQLRYRYRSSDSNGGDPIGTLWSSWLTAPTVNLDIGYWKVEWEATDANPANAARCTYLVQILDNEPPTPVCVDHTVNLNGATEIEIPGDQLWDEAASSDNCNIDSDFFDVPAVTISCDQIGSVIPITVNIPDLFGNHGSCTANITVQGLPCGLQTDQINCSESAQAGYDPTTTTYNLSAQNCYDPNFYSNSDAQSMIQQELCGDSEIIAHVDGIDGDAWAGIFMRESNDPGAKMLQLAVNNSGLAQRQLRQSTGSLAYKHLFQNQGKHWLRLTRSGNQFGAFLSLDGNNWAPVLMTNIPMTNCIQTGLFVSNTTSGSSATAWFDNVQIIPPAGGNALQTPMTNGVGARQQERGARGEELPMANSQLLITQYPNDHSPSHTDLQVYPNPTSGALNLDFQGFMNQPLELRIFNQHGQILMTKSYSEGHSPMEKLWVEHLQNGLYLLQIKVGEQVFSKKINVIH